jgi:alpha-L-arabinofuranosidase
MYLEKQNYSENYTLKIINETARYICPPIDSTQFYSIDNIKNLPSKLITKTGNNNPYNTKVWRLGNETTPLKAPPSVFDLKIYPNPSQDEMNIELVGDNEGGSYNISVYNTLGQNVFSTNSSSARNWVLKKKEIGVGAFILKVNSGQKSVNKKIVFD